jgi:hypothetical protein
VGGRGVVVSLLLFPKFLKKQLKMKKSFDEEMEVMREKEERMRKGEGELEEEGEEEGERKDEEEGGTNEKWFYEEKTTEFLKLSTFECVIITCMVTERGTEGDGDREGDGERERERERESKKEKSQYYRLLYLIALSFSTHLNFL